MIEASGKNAIEPIEKSGRERSARLSAALCRFIALALMPALTLLNACSAPTGAGESSGGAKSAGTSNDAAQIHSNSISFEPIDIRSSSLMAAGIPYTFSAEELELSGCPAERPYYLGPNSARLNQALLAALERFSKRAAAIFDVPLLISAEPVFSRDGILSFWLCAYETKGDDLPVRELERESFTYDIYRGKALALTECFGGISSALGAELAEMLTDEAKRQGYSLLSPILPPDDRNGFIFDYGENGAVMLCFFYHPYEIALPSQGSPLIALPVEKLIGYANEDAAIARLGEKAEK